jgi:hypothetical protein
MNFTKDTSSSSFEACSLLSESQQQTIVKMSAESSLNQHLALDFSSSAAAHSASCCPGASLI